MAVWGVTSRNSNGEIARIEASTKASALKKARSLYGGKGERDYMGRPTKQAVYVTKLYDNPGSRTRSRGRTKAERAVSSQKASAKRRVAVALAKYLRQQNPGTKLAGAKVEKLGGGVIKITPIKMNRGRKR
jgi:hypothetical protein